MPSERDKTRLPEDWGHIVAFWLVVAFCVGWLLLYLLNKWLMGRDDLP